ncbi:MAG: hypothetical protein L0Y56_11050, partial [Nitrospira sp.]|nr:hypothetical protein [Nitrospira sp.]
KGDMISARKNIEVLESVHKALVEAKDTYWASQVEIHRRAAAAWLARAEGKNEEALSLMRSAADLENSTEKHPVTPGAILPARELLAELLIELNQPAQALSEFEASLRVTPNRFNALYGAAQAAAKSGDLEKAKAFYAKLVALADQADSERQELREAKAVLAAKQK